jgi:hypothetical protein
MNTADSIPMRSVTLEKFRFGIQQCLDRRMLACSFDIESMVEPLANEMVIRLEAAIASQRAGVLRVPATWWDHFKEAKFPTWAKKRWPVKWTEYQARILYPGIAIPDNGRVCYRFDKIV